MNWNGQADIKDRIFSMLVYLIPLYYALPFGGFLLRQFPALQVLALPLLPLELIYSAIPLAGFVIFLLLYAAVVNNPNVSRFIRFNTLQAILLDILLFVVSLVMNLVAQGLGTNLLTETLYNVIFLGTLAACLYAMVESARGRYADLPALSETVNGQLPW